MKIFSYICRVLHTITKYIGGYKWRQLQINILEQKLIYDRFLLQCIHY